MSDADGLRDVVGVLLLNNYVGVHLINLYRVGIVSLVVYYHFVFIVRRVPLQRWRATSLMQLLLRHYIRAPVLSRIRVHVLMMFFLWLGKAGQRR